MKGQKFSSKIYKKPQYQSYHTLTFNVPVGVENETLPDNFFQVAAYPNPFNNSTTLQIDHFESGEVTVNIYSLTGEKAMEPVSLHKEAGTLTLPIEFRSQPSGVYVADINFVSSSGKMNRKHQKLVYLK
ncbi:MAG: T9SS type A sorting domain-containing protein [Ignavibacteriales bacterium]|nr:T9SS type A sorting domain-containing protein [Ignavibacteriales bacterium]